METHLYEKRSFPTSPSPVSPESVRRDVGNVSAPFCTCLPTSKGKHIFKCVLTSTLEVSAVSFQVYRLLNKTV